MSSKSRYNPNPIMNQPVVDTDMTAAITQLMMDKMFGADGKPQRPKRCGECDFCHDIGSDGIRCFAEPPKMVWRYVEDQETFVHSQMRPKVGLDDPACRHGEMRR